MRLSRMICSLAVLAVWLAACGRTPPTPAPDTAAATLAVLQTQLANLQAQTLNAPVPTPAPDDPFPQPTALSAAVTPIPSPAPTTVSTLLKTLTPNVGQVFSIAYSPRGGVLALGTEKGVQLWDTASGQLLRAFTDPTDWVTSLSFSGDGHLLAAVAGEGLAYAWDVDTGTVRLWDVAAKSLAQSFAAGNKITSVSFSPDGRTLAASTFAGTVLLWAVG